MTRVRLNKTILAIAGTSAVFFAIGYLIPKEPVIRQVEIETPALYKVAGVIDGDTIVVNMNDKPETIRFIGVDTPETVHPTKPKECYGEEASKKTLEMLLSKFVYLVPDPQTKNVDKYGRLLRYVFLEDGTFVNAKLIEGGFGFNYIYDPFQFMKEFDRLEKQAKSTKIGLWGACNL